MKSVLCSGGRDDPQQTDQMGESSDSEINEEEILSFLEEHKEDEALDWGDEEDEALDGGDEEGAEGEAFDGGEEEDADGYEDDDEDEDEALFSLLWESDNLSEMDVQSALLLVDSGSLDNLTSESTEEDQKQDQELLEDAQAFIADQARATRLPVRSLLRFGTWVWSFIWPVLCLSVRHLHPSSVPPSLPHPSFSSCLPSSYVFRNFHALQQHVQVFQECFARCVHLRCSAYGSYRGVRIAEHASPYALNQNKSRWDTQARVHSVP